MITKVPSGRQIIYYSTHTSLPVVEADVEQRLDSAIVEIETKLKQLKQNYEKLSLQERVESTSLLFDSIFHTRLRYFFIVTVKNTFSIQDKILRFSEFESELLDFIVSEEGYHLKIPENLSVYYYQKSKNSMKILESILKKSKEMNLYKKD